MAKYEEHCKETLDKLGKEWGEVHKWLDEYYESMGPEHRGIRHNLWGVRCVINKWGYEAGAAACLHIYRDEHTHEKKGELWLPKKTDQYLIKYRHDDCPVKPGIKWKDVWDCACNGECPACGTKDIEPVDWTKINE